MGTFTGAEYRLMGDEMARSAGLAAPLIVDWLRAYARPGWEPRTVLDVGCGPGWWAARFGELTGGEVLGVDGPDGGEQLDGRYVEVDLAGDWRAVVGDDGWDVAVCLEVAEHLAAPLAERLIGDLTAVARVVVFSAAIPGQGGVGHVNERWQPYWADLFGWYGWETTAAIRDPLWSVEGLAPYYPQNMMIAYDRRCLAPPERPVTAVVHPGVWCHITRRC